MNQSSINSGNNLDQTDVRFLVEKNADGIIVVDEEGTVLFANPAAAEVFGRAPDALIGSPIGIPLASDTTEIAIHKPGGELAEAEIRVVDTLWNHRPARLASIRDVSARKVIEERMRRAANMEAIGRLTAGIAHDFNNLLTVVLGNLENAQRQPHLSATVTQALENATRGARRAASLTGRLLAFARRKALEPRAVDMTGLVVGMSDLLQRTLGEAISVRVSLAPDLWAVEADPTELEAAILNLAVNARDAMPDGGEILIEAANVEFTADAGNIPQNSAPGFYVMVAVTDTGAGMKPDVLKQVFEPFFTTKGGRGTGLGLSQVYGFAKQSGGYATLYSEPGVGTTARIYLPRAEPGAGPPPTVDAEAEGRQPPRGRAGESILVVEDDPDVRAYTVNSLRELGYEVFEAGDAAAALAIIERQPDLRVLFTDLGLPGGVDGKTLSERARVLRPSLEVVITSAYAAKALIHDGRLEPGVELLSKPFTFAALATRIREVMDRSDNEAGADPREEHAVRILLVEDELLIRMLLEQILVSLGCEVEQARSFREAIEKLDRVGESLSGAIIDLGLPDRPGDELVLEIRKSRPDLPIMLATGYADEAVRKRLSRVTPLQIVNKPFQANDIETAIRQLGIPLARDQ